MKIAIIEYPVWFKYQSHKFSGGTEKVSMDLANNLVEHNHTVDYFVSEDGALEKDKGVFDIKFNTIKLEGYFSKEYNSKIKKPHIYDWLLKYENDYDVLLIMDYGVGNHPSQLRNFYNDGHKHNCKIVIVSHNNPSGMSTLMYAKNYIEAKSQADKVGCILKHASVSEYSKNLWDKIAKQPITDGILCFQWVNNPKEAIPSDGSIIIAQRLNIVKNIPVALEAAGLSGRETHFFTFEDSVQEEYQSELEKVNVILKKYPNVHMLLNRPHSEILEYTRKAACALFTGLNDSLSQTVFEGLMYGVPPVFQYTSDSPNKLERLAPYCMLEDTDYYYDVYTKRLRFQNRAEAIAEALRNVDESFEKRQELQKVICNKFTRENTYNTFINLL